MKKYKIILSGGSIPWLGIQESISYCLEAKYDGLELLPTRVVVNEIEKNIKSLDNLYHVYGIHQNWRLDMGSDKEYNISFFWRLIYNFIRIIFFPEENKSNKITAIISRKLNIPVTVHDISKKWTYSDTEFIGGVLYEIIGTKRSPEEIREWLKDKHHKIVVDTRDDQSLLWAESYGYKNWQSFWRWLGLENIEGVQLTLIGFNNLKKILSHKKSLAEEQLLWLHKQKWRGIITVEVNPLMLLMINRGRLKKGLQVISAFVERTLIKGKNWSI